MLQSSHIDTWYRDGDSFAWKGNDVFYRDTGAGPPMLLIHGFPTAGCDWAGIADGLSARFRLIIPDLLDYGRSLNRTGQRWHIHDQADMIVGLMAALDIRSTHVLAHDVGDTVAQELAARHDEGSLPFRIESLVLMNGGIFPAHHRPRTVQKLLSSPLGPLLARHMNKDRFMSALADVFGPDTRPDAGAQDVLWDVSVGVNGARSFARRIHYMKDRRRYEDRWVCALKQLAFPAMMINGTADPVSGGHVCDVIEREAPAMKVVRLDGIGHFPLLEAPDVCLSHILEFHGNN
jgi:pimeloyl-ACP methyl ester carboxylesterase